MCDAAAAASGGNCENPEPFAHTPDGPITEAVTAKTPASRGPPTLRKPRASKKNRLTPIQIQQLRIPPRYRNGRSDLMPGVGPFTVTGRCHWSRFGEGSQEHPVVLFLACLQLVPIETWPDKVRQELWRQFNNALKDEAFYAPEVWRYKVWCNLAGIFNWIANEFTEWSDDEGPIAHEPSYLEEIRDLIDGKKADTRVILPLTPEQENHEGKLYVYLVPVSTDDKGWSKFRFVTQKAVRHRKPQ